MKPVAWIDPYFLEKLPFYDCSVSGEKTKKADIPLYTYPHPDNLGLAESIIKQQQLEIEALKKQVIGDDYVFVCKNCGDELGIKFKEQEK